MAVAYGGEPGVGHLGKEASAERREAGGCAMLDDPDEGQGNGMAVAHLDIGIEQLALVGDAVALRADQGRGVADEGEGRQDRAGADPSHHLEGRKAPAGRALAPFVEDSGAERAVLAAARHEQHRGRRGAGGCSGRPEPPVDQLMESRCSAGLALQRRIGNLGRDLIGHEVAHRRRRWCRRRVDRAAGHEQERYEQ